MQLKLKKVMNELNKYCESTGRYDICDKAEFLVRRFPNTFKDLTMAYKWLDEMRWGTR